MKCNKCGSEVEDNATFCTICGDMMENFSPEPEMINNEDNKEIDSKNEDKSSNDLKIDVEEKNVFDKIDDTLVSENVDSSVEIKNSEVTPESTKDEVETKKSKISMGLKIKMTLVLVVLIGIFVAYSYISDKISNQPNETLAYIGNTNLYTLPTAGKKSTEITSGTTANAITYVQGALKNSEIFYPKEIVTNSDNINQFKLYYSLKNVETLAIDKVQGNYLVSENGKYILYFNDVTSLYNKPVATLFAYDFTTKTQIADNVELYSIKISKNGNYAIYVKGDSNDLYLYNFKTKESKKIDDGISNIYKVDDNFNQIVYTKPAGTIANKPISNVFVGAYNKSSKKIASNVVDGAMGVFDNQLVYEKPVSAIPSLDSAPAIMSNLSKSDQKTVKSNWETFYGGNFIEVWTVNLDGSKEVLIDNAVYKIDYISGKGEEIVLTKSKPLDKLTSDDVSSMEDIIKPSNLDTVLYNNNTEYAFPRQDPNTLLNPDNNGTSFAYSTDESMLYYVDTNDLYTCKITNANIINTLFEKNVNFVSYDKNTLIYETVDNKLTQILKGVKTQIDSDVDPKYINLQNNILTYLKNIADDGSDLYQVVNSKSKKLSDKATAKLLIESNSNIFFNDDKGLCVSRAGKVSVLCKDESACKLLDATN